MFQNAVTLFGSTSHPKLAMSKQADVLPWYYRHATTTAELV
jgi:hypothetical protein